ncbi:sodium:proton antiporter [soil metagenome]
MIIPTRVELLGMPKIIPRSSQPRIASHIPVGFDANMATADPIVHLGHPEARVPGYEIPEATAAPLSRRQIVIGFLAAVGVAWIAYFLEHYSHGAQDSRTALPWLIPFVLLLAGIALMPFIARHWWEHNYATCSVILAVIIIVYYIWQVEYGPANLARAGAEYISFIFLLGSLFVVSGGILIRLRCGATPLANTTVLLIGAIIANIFGTTGASMLLIRPYLRMNKGRLRPFHVVFFIFIVANAGGSLTPIGDPPLFLGYLIGVPFFWVAEHCWPIWMVVNFVLLAVFCLLDRRGRKSAPDPSHKAEESPFGPTVSLLGAVNLVFIAMIIGGIFLPAPWREMMMAGGAFGSLWFTPRRVHAENHFNYAPIREIAFLFFGIFMTMLPALNYLSHVRESGQDIPLHTPGQYYFACGTLSGVLDNAPTYLTFLKTELAALDGAEASSDRARVKILLNDVAGNNMLIAISMGAVLFGAATYIGNGPNFMVKSIAEHAGAPVPSFFGYILKFTIPILLPVLILVWLVFLR